MDGKYDDFPACRKKCRGVIISDKMYQDISKEYDIIITEKNGSKEKHKIIITISFKEI